MDYNHSNTKHQEVETGRLTPYREAAALLVVENRKTMKAPVIFGGHSYAWQRREIHEAARALRINVASSSCELWQDEGVGNRTGLRSLIDEAKQTGWRWLIVPTQAYLGIDPEERQFWETELALAGIQVIEANHDCGWCA